MHFRLIYPGDMAESPAKRAKGEGIADAVRVLSPSEYSEWLRAHDAKEMNEGGCSARILRAGSRFVKEQILGRVEGEWHSLQLYRDDVPGIDLARRDILEKKPLSDEQKEKVLFLETHRFADEVAALRLADASHMTPALTDVFRVEIEAGGEFCLGVTVQQKLDRVFRHWEDDLGFDGMVDRICRVGFHQYTRAVDSMAKAGIVYFDWNCGNMGITQTSRLQLIDFACAIRPAPFALRDPDSTRLQREADILWRQTIMYRAMTKSWRCLAEKNDNFYQQMYRKATTSYRYYKKLCHEFLTQHAVPETDFDAVLSVDMLSESPRTDHTI